MSAAATSRADLVEVLKSGIRTDYNGLNYPRDPGRFNLAGIIRDAFTNTGRYGWRGTVDDAAEYADVLRNHYRPQHRRTGPARDASNAATRGGRHVLEEVAA